MPDYRVTDIDDRADGDFNADREHTVPWNELRDAKEEIERLFDLIKCRCEAVAWVLDLLDALHVPRAPDNHDSLADVVLFRLLNLVGHDKKGCDKKVIAWVRGMDLKLEVLERSSAVHRRWAGYSSTESDIEGIARCFNKLIADAEQAREIRSRLEALETPKPKPEPEPEPEKTWKNEALGAIVAQALPVYSLYLLGCDVSGVRFEFDKRKFLVDPHLCVQEIFEPHLLWTSQAALIEQTIKYAAQSHGKENAQ